MITFYITLLIRFFLLSFVVVIYVDAVYIFGLHKRLNRLKAKKKKKKNDCPQVWG